MSTVLTCRSDFRAAVKKRARAYIVFLCALILAAQATHKTLANTYTGDQLAAPAQSYDSAKEQALKQQSSDQPSNANKPKSSQRKIVQQGLAVELSIEPAHSNEMREQRVHENDDAIFRFRITYANTGAPLTGGLPQAWMALRHEDQSKEAPICSGKVAKFLSESIVSSADIDLNVYYVLALNSDASISVVDPRFGFGGTKLLALVPLNSPGEDWALASDWGKLFVSMPDSNQVAVINTLSWSVAGNIDVKPNPTRIALQPGGHYLWVAHSRAGNQAGDVGITVIDTDKLQVAASIATGNGPHEMAFTTDSRFCIVTNRDDDTVTIIDVEKLAKTKIIKTGHKPASIAFSPLSQLVYVTHEDGAIAVLDANKQEVVARMKGLPGLGQIKFAPGGRFGFVVNPEKDVVYILDAANNRIVQTSQVEKQPDQVAFTDTLAYVRHRGSETVVMLPLNEIGTEGKPIPRVDFPGGQSAFGKVSRPSPADGILQVPGMNAVVVANPADKAIYFYEEGMAAPKGNFSNYSRQPRAVLILDRRLRERSAGVYETVARLTAPGIYDLAFFLDTPRVIHCFEVSVDERPELAQQRRERQVSIEPLIKDRVVRVGQRTRLQFRLSNPTIKKPITGLTDVRILTSAPGNWNRRQWAYSIGDGIYEVEFVPPKAGLYYVYVESLSLGITLSNPFYIILEAKDAGSDSEK